MVEVTRLAPDSGIIGNSSHRNDNLHRHINDIEDYYEIIENQDFNEDLAVENSTIATNFNIARTVQQVLDKISYNLYSFVRGRGDRVTDRSIFSMIHNRGMKLLFSF